MTPPRVLRCDRCGQLGYEPSNVPCNNLLGHRWIVGAFVTWGIEHLSDTEPFSPPPGDVETEVV